MQKENRDLEAYLQEKGVKLLFKNLLKTICVKKPEDPIEFAIHYLERAHEDQKSKLPPTALRVSNPNSALAESTGSATSPRQRRSLVGPSPYRGQGQNRGSDPATKVSLYEARFRAGYARLLNDANRLLREVTPLIFNTVVEIAEAYKPPVIMICLEALSLIMYERAPKTWPEAVTLLRRPDLLDNLQRAKPDSLSIAGVSKLRNLLKRQQGMDYNQLRPVNVINNWMEAFEAAAAYYVDHSRLLKTSYDLVPPAGMPSA